MDRNEIEKKAFEVKYYGKTPKEIAEEYFDRGYLKREGRTDEEINALIEGFIEGLEYIFPSYSNLKLIAEIFEKQYQ